MIEGDLGKLGKEKKKDLARNWNREGRNNDGTLNMRDEKRLIVLGRIVYPSQIQFGVIRLITRSWTGTEDCMYLLMLNRCFRLDDSFFLGRSIFLLCEKRLPAVTIQNSYRGEACLCVSV